MYLCRSRIIWSLLTLKLVLAVFAKELNIQDQIKAKKTRKNVWKLPESNSPVLGSNHICWDRFDLFILSSEILHQHWFSKPLEQESSQRKQKSSNKDNYWEIFIRSNGVYTTVNTFEGKPWGTQIGSMKNKEEHSSNNNPKH